MLLSNLEYIPLRLLRRFVFRDAFLLRWGRYFPYYRTNLNQTDPVPLVSAYARYVSLDAAAILEIGVGATNSTGYELASRQPSARVTLLEPYVALDEESDRAHLAAVAARCGCSPDSLTSRVRRVTTLDGEPDGAFPLVLSSSVLEHVGDPPALFADLRRVLAPGGTMLHRVDYRDHFFKYPLHFLQFSRSTWNRWLNPGDLPRWRLYDHVEALEKAGFGVQLPETCHDPECLAAITPRLSSDFRRDDPRVGVTFATILARPRR